MTGVAVAPLPDRPPAPGRLEFEWAVERGRGFIVVAGQVLVSTGRGVESYRLRDGEPNWRYREPEAGDGVGVQGITSTNGVVVVVSGGPWLEGEPTRRNTGLRTGAGDRCAHR